MSELLETERLILRRPRADDLSAWQRFFLSDRAIHVGGGSEADEGVAWRAFASIIGHWTLNGCGPFVLDLRETGKPVGSVGPWYPGGWPERELGWNIWEAELEGGGYAWEAVVRIRRHVFDDLGWKKAVSYIDPENKRSIALAEGLGCILDAEAAIPDGYPVLVYRHPAPPDAVGG